MKEKGVSGAQRILTGETDKRIEEREKDLRPLARALIELAIQIALDEKLNEVKEEQAA